ncbi:MAG: hypothetical protein ACRDR6_19405 [Pseudonocardiaceae bacterium]
MSSSRYNGHRYPTEIINYGMWLRHLSPLSFREVEETITERGVVVSYETIPQRCQRFSSPGHAQRFLSAFRGISPHFGPSPPALRRCLPPRHDIPASLSGTT